MTEVVLVTGAAGFIGSHLSERLVRLGYRVVGLDNFDDCYPATIKWANIRALQGEDGFRMEQGDIRDRTLVSRIFAENGVSLVVHLAARAGVRPSLEQPLLYQDVNIGGTVNLLEVSRQFGARKFVFASSSSVYGLNGKAPFTEESAVNYPISPYAASKAAGELFCRSYSHLYNLPIVVLRLFTVYGPRQRPEMAIHRFVRMIDRGEEITLFGDGTTSRDYTYVDDVIDGFQAALGYRGEAFAIFNLGSGRSVGLNHLVALIEQALNKKARIRYQEAAPGDVSLTLADISKAKAALGYQPKVAIEEGVPLFVEWYLGNKGG